MGQLTFSSDKNMKHIYLFFFSFSLVNCKPQESFNSKSCKVREVASGELKPCKSAFIVKDKTYYGCTTEGSPKNGKAWCSTKVDITWNHEGGDFFGFCPDDNSCLTHNQGLEEHEKLKKSEASVRSVLIDPSLAASSCQCQDYSTCDWSNRVVNQLSVIPETLPFYKILARQFQIQICDKEKRHIWCCRDGEQARGSELEILNAKEVLTEDKNSGKWKPDGEKGECGARTILSNIVGGKKTKLGDFPYMALLGRSTTIGTGFPPVIYSCGGSLINKWYVLTAAHCFDEEQGFEDVTEVILGEHDVKTDPDCPKPDKNGNQGTCAPKAITRKVDEIIIHESYSEPLPNRPINDIALIRLSEPVPLYSEDPSLSAILPVCLPWSSENPARFLSDGDKTVVTGWGANTDNKFKLSQNLKQHAVSNTVLEQVTLPVANNKCSMDSFFQIDEEKQLCAGAVPDKDSCNGDSGGPLVYREFAGEPWYQVGLVSYGTNVCGSGEPGVYTRVAGYLQWIDSKLKP